MEPLNVLQQQVVQVPSCEGHLREDDDVRVVALNNEYPQFKVFLEPLLEGKVVDRQESNDVLSQAKPSSTIPSSANPSRLS